MAATQQDAEAGFAVTGWNGGAVVSGAEAGTHSVMAREEAEIKAAVASARLFPRNEEAAYAKIIRSCQRPTFAENTQYSFPRGRKKNPATDEWEDNIISGPSIDLAREMARCWGNIRYGLRVVSIDRDTVHIKGYALDLETNAYAEAEDKFARLIQRAVGKGPDKKTQWVEPDERDLRELINRRGAILKRNCILEILPPDITDDAMRAADTTLELAAKGELKQDRAAMLRRLVLLFDRVGVSSELLAERVGHELKALTEEEAVELHKIYKSIADGVTTRGEHFNIGNTAEEKRAQSAGASKMNEPDDEPAQPETTSNQVAPEGIAPVPHYLAAPKKNASSHAKLVSLLESNYDGIGEAGRVKWMQKLTGKSSTADMALAELHLCIDAIEDGRGPKNEE